RGVLAVMRRPILPTVEAVCRGARRIAVLEDIMDSSNVGAIIRSAAALGMDAVLVTPRCSDPLLRRAARVSMGTVFQIPWTVIGSSPGDWPGRGMELLSELGFRTAAMALSHDTVGIADPCLKEAGRLAVILGTEGTGLSSETVRLADWTVKIPMFHGVDSLNVAAASAVAFWEVCRPVDA
ncbi:MAG: RNA methyltransferase, partial [Clostridia bacterium]|nr:RNA methyltransferase [Clostridia bacterium]